MGSVVPATPLIALDPHPAANANALMKAMVKE
jgi:hypothetical protein